MSQQRHVIRDARDLIRAEEVVGFSARQRGAVPALGNRRTISAFAEQVQRVDRPDREARVRIRVGLPVQERAALAAESANGARTGRVVLEGRRLRRECEGRHGLDAVREEEERAGLSTALRALARVRLRWHRISGTAVRITYGMLWAGSYSGLEVVVLREFYPVSQGAAEAAAFDGLGS